MQLSLVYIGLAILLISAVTGAVLAFVFLRNQRSKQGHTSQADGKAYERKAATLLKKAGYRILDKQPILTMTLELEGKDHDFDITPDFLVEKDGERFYVEVKTWHGETPAIHHAAIRRQVLEYIAAGGLACLLIERKQTENEKRDWPDWRTADPDKAIEHIREGW